MSLRGSLGALFGGSTVELAGAPEAELVVAPGSVDEIVRLLDFASEHGLVVLPWGSGSHQGLGRRVAPDVIVSTARLDAVDDWQPEDLTIAMGSGMTLGALDELIGSRRQSAVLPEDRPEATVGGVIAAGVSGWRRLRYGPTRDRVLEVTLVTGDARVVRGGARVVKNVTGYDLPRLMTGSLGSLGIIVSACLKLWPDQEAAATVVVDDPVRALAIAERPLAVLETAERSTVHLTGTAAEVDAQVATLGGSASDGLVWPARPTGDLVVSIRVPPAAVTDAVERVEGPFVAAHGVGEVTAAVSDAAVIDLRLWAESVGGAVVVLAAPADLYDRVDPWGTPPDTVPLQRRIKAAFDPAGVMAPGRLPGGV